MRRPTAFTLVELLVVVTIIAILLAMLTPAMDRAIYQAEMAVCGANLKGLGQGVIIYATDNKRTYPHRKTVGGTRAMALSRKGDKTFDVRPSIKNYIAIRQMLNDPFCKEADLENDLDIFHYAGYSLWFGWKIAGNKGMRSIGDKLQYGTYQFNLLASDMDEIYYDATLGQVFNSHPDNASLTSLLTRSNADDTLSWWYRGGLTLPGAATLEGTTNPNTVRGALDSNFVYDDTSVIRINDIISHTQMEWDDRFVSVTSLASEDANWRLFLPK